MLVAFAVFAFTSCKQAGETPEAVAEKFLKHLNNKEWAEAKVLGTEATGQFLEMMKSLSEMSGEEEAKDVTIENLVAEVDGDKAVVSYTIDGKDESLPMKKVDGKWLVNMDKEDQEIDVDGEEDYDMDMEETSELVFDEEGNVIEGEEVEGEVIIE